MRNEKEGESVSDQMVVLQHSMRNKEERKKERKRREREKMRKKERVRE